METLLKTKLFVPHHAGALVHRHRLVELLASSIARKMTLISAPAGFGKTTLIGDWIGQSEFPVSWISLDERDSDPGRFLAYLSASLQLIGIDVDIEQLSPIQTADAEQTETTLISILNQIAEARCRFAVVLDDYHRIEGEAVHQIVSYLVEHLPPTVHLIVATRADPPLPIARLRARGQLTEIRAADLRFSLAEGNAFLNQVYQLGLQPDAVQQLVARADGWVAGLQMASIALRGREDTAAYIQRFSGTHDYIVDFLTTEVLDQQPPRVQEFLLKTSILDRLTAPLCANLTGQDDCQQTLRDLRANNIFLKALDDEHKWFAYHGLFKDLLSQQLLEKRPEDISRLYQAASAWCEKHDLPYDAINYALHGGQTERAADLVEMQAERSLRQSEIVTFIHWIEKLPQAAVYSRPNLCIFYAWALFISNRTPEIAAAYLNRVTAVDAQTQGKLNAVRSVHAAMQRQLPEAIAFARDALRLLPPADYFFRQITGWNLSAALFLAGDGTEGEKVLEDVARVSLASDNRMVAVVTLCRLGRIRMQLGDLHRSNAFYRQARDVASEKRTRPIPAACEALFGLGRIRWEWYQLEDARILLEEGLLLCKRWREVASIEGRITLAHLQQSQGDTHAATQTMAETKQIAAENLNRKTGIQYVDLQEAYLALRQGNLSLAGSWAEQRQLARYSGTQQLDEPQNRSAGVIRAFELLVYARAMIARKHFDDALALLVKIQPTFLNYGDKAKIIESQILLGIVHDALANREEAFHAVQTALELAAPARFLRAFVDEGTAVLDLCRRIRARCDQSEFVDEILAAAGSPRTPSMATVNDQHLIEPLSEREIEILKLLESDLSVPEIAANIHISVSTLRTHVRNIYRKLDTHSRFETVARAGELGLL